MAFQLIFFIYFFLSIVFVFFFYTIFGSSTHSACAFSLSLPVSISIYTSERVKETTRAAILVSIHTSQQYEIERRFRMAVNKYLYAPP